MPVTPKAGNNSLKASSVFSRRHKTIAPWVHQRSPVVCEASEGQNLKKLRTDLGKAASRILKNIAAKKEYQSLKIRLMPDFYRLKAQKRLSAPKKKTALFRLSSFMPESLICKEAAPEKTPPGAAFGSCTTSDACSLRNC